MRTRDKFCPNICGRVGAAPFLVVNDGSGTPEEAARWAAYCNEPASGKQGSRRAAYGHSQPYGVHLWGVGNEVWGQWQIGYTNADRYATRLKEYLAALRSVDRSIRIVAVGDKVMSDAPDDPGRIWNETVLRQAGEQIDDLSFHIYQPDQEGWKEVYDPEMLHHIVCAAPLDVERIIGRIADQISKIVPSKNIGVALDEWNLWLPPPPGAGSMHQVDYTLRDALYVAGMLNVFLRQCQRLSIANLAQLVNVLPAIVTDESRAYATPIYYPFWMYRQMQKLALRVTTDVATFNCDALGNIAAQRSVPYLDMTATRDPDGRWLALGMVNRHPQRAIQVRIALRGFGKLKASRTWLLSGQTPLAANSFEAPDRVSAREIDSPEVGGDWLQQDLPASSLTMCVLARLDSSE